MTDLDLCTLFETWERYSTYASLDEELLAVASGLKAMSYFAFPDADIDSDELYIEVCKISSQLNLFTMKRKGIRPEWEGPIPHTYLFVLRDDVEVWRVPAFLFAMNVALGSGWTTAIDEFMARLLGYSEIEVERWADDLKRFHINRQESTVLFLMSSTQASNVRALGHRAIDPQILNPPATAFYNLRGKVVRREASNLIPMNHELLRAAVDQAFFRKAFPAELIKDQQIEIATFRIDAGGGTALNLALRSRFQILGHEGWC